MNSITSFAQVALLRDSEVRAAPWKNGGGVTREIAAYPAGSGLESFDWRVSIADVGAAGAFSSFLGIDRSLLLLSGRGLHLLSQEGVSHTARSDGVAVVFSGEDVIDAPLVDGPVQDFNLMVRKSRYRGEVVRIFGASTHCITAEAVILYCISTTAEVEVAGLEPFILTEGDALKIEMPQALSVDTRSHAHIAMAIINKREF